MIYSMTGFGRGDATSDGISVTAEIRTLNNRHFDFGLRGSRPLLNFENELREICRSQIQRGKLLLSLNESRAGSDNGSSRIDSVAAEKLARELSELAVSSVSRIRLPRSLLRFPDLLVSR